MKYERNFAERIQNISNGCYVSINADKNHWLECARASRIRKKQFAAPLSLKKDILLGPPDTE